MASSGYILFVSILDAHTCCGTLFHASGHLGCLSLVGLFFFSLFFLCPGSCLLIVSSTSVSSVCRSGFSSFRGLCVSAVLGFVPCGAVGFFGGFLFPFWQCLSSFGIVSVVRTVKSWCFMLGVYASLLYYTGVGSVHWTAGVAC